MERSRVKFLSYGWRWLFETFMKVLASPKLASMADYQPTIEERRMFHTMDRNMYLLLVRDLARNPVESLQVIAFWMWLERGCSYNFIHHILPLQILMVSKLADEALACFVCIKNQSPIPFAIALMPLTLDFFKKGGICKEFLCKNWQIGFEELQKMIREVCVPCLSDIYDHACLGGFRRCLSSPSPSPANSSMPSSSGGNTEHAVDAAPSESQATPVRRSTTTVFITFSKGFPVSEEEVSVFCNELSGNQVQFVKMQTVRRGLQPLYAKVVFWSPSCIDDIVARGNKAKFSINGKHVWIREFEATDRFSVE